ncbi:hypothetical protein [Actinomadura flavalba]|uniref:hypothetical protein n=1 Tax=Actinomadura flavalba TaxID=1120938 RepID=UPI00036133D0|nr:hypothetical protein [Actinomadura flavalba]
MNDTTFHLTHSHLHGPAERTLVEIRLSALSDQPLNTYTDPAPPHPRPVTTLDPAPARPRAHRPHRRKALAA